MTVGSATPLSDVVSPEALEPASGGSARLVLGREPDAYVSPGSVQEVVEVLEWARATSSAVLPVGTGAHVGDRRAERPYVALSTARMTGIEIYEPADLTLTAKAGTGLAELGGMTGEHRQWLPFDPMDAAKRTLGGLAATGVTGPLWAGYGHVRNHVLGMTVVCGDGRALRLGGRVVKNVAGFDLIKPMVGSRGRLAVITAVTVRLFPVPTLDRVLVLEAADLVSVVPTARAVATARTLPASIVLSLSTGAASFLVRLHGADETVDADQRMLEAHAGVSFAAKEGTEAEALLAATRDAGADAEVLLYASTLPSQLGALLDSIQGALRGVDCVVVADVAEGCARVAFSGAGYSDAVLEMCAGVEALGGTVAVHRCPIDASPAALSTPLSPDAHEIGEGVKRIFDPSGVLL